jgi:hypothetical protein
MKSYAVRKRAGDVHEQRVTAALVSQGWEVAPWGLDTLPASIREAIWRSESRWRYFPDLVAARHGETVVIDAKDRMPDTPGQRFSIKRECVQFGLQWMGAFGLPVFYVCGEQLAVLTPQEVMTYGTCQGGAYYLVWPSFARRFGEVFGEAQVAVA